MAILKTDELDKSSFNRSDHLVQVKKDLNDLGVIPEHIQTKNGSRKYRD